MDKDIPDSGFLCTPDCHSSQKMSEPLLWLGAAGPPWGGGGIYPRESGEGEKPEGLSQEMGGSREAEARLGESGSLAQESEALLLQGGQGENASSHPLLLRGLGGGLSGGALVTEGQRIIRGVDGNGHRRRRCPEMVDAAALRHRVCLQAQRACGGLGLFCWAPGEEEVTKDF